MASAHAERSIAESEGGAGAPERLRAANRRTALALSAIAVVFFAGIIATRFVDSSAAGIAVMGVAVVTFLAIAIGRNLRGR